MAVCPECEADVEMDEYDVDKGEIISCPECGVELEVVGLVAPRSWTSPAQDEEDWTGVTTPSDLETRRAALERILLEMGSVVVAYSGGVDSAYLAVAAHRVLGARSLAVTADSESLSARAARAGARGGAPLRLSPPPRPHARAREPALPPQRRRTAATTARRSCSATWPPSPWRRASPTSPTASSWTTSRTSGPATARPGRRESEAPLAEAGLTKEDVRALSRELGLPTADLPASPCLSSRVPYGTPVTLEALRRVERAEAAVRALGFRELRVRHLGDSARVEIAREEMGRLEDAALRSAIEQAVRSAGLRAGRASIPRATGAAA